MRYDNEKLQKALAHHYVMGLMKPKTQKRFERLMLSKASVRDWVFKTEQKWHRLSERVPPMKVPATIWPSIEARLFGIQPARIEKADKVTASNDSVWKGWAVAASMVAVVLSGYLLMQAPTSTPSFQDRYMALVLDESKQASWHLGIDAEQQSLIVTTVTPQALPNDKSFELWLIADNQAAPISMGLIPNDGQLSLPIEADLLKSLGAAPAKFAVTVEPLGGSPTGQPTSAPIYIGDMVQLKS